MALPNSGLAKKLNDLLPDFGSPIMIDFQKHYGMDGSPFNLIPLKYTTARVQIFDGVAKIELQHDYKNQSDKTLETSFKFQVSPDCAVTSLVIITKDKEIEAKIVAKQKAQQKYDDAIASGNVGYQMEYDADSNDLLSMKIGNMVPGQELSVRITFLVKLPVFDKSWAFVLSPTLTPCLSLLNATPTDLLDLAPMPGEHLVCYGDIEIQIISHSPLTRVSCLSHQPVINFGDGNLSARLTLKKEDRLNFQLLLRSQDINEPKVFLQRSPDYKEEYAALVSFFPNFVESEEAKLTAVDTSKDKQYEQEQEEEELQGAGQFIFVLDRSGSMGGNNIMMAREAARLFLLSLPSDSRFNIVSFGSSFFSMYAQSVKYSQQTMQHALTSVASFDADLGGTQIYQPLASIYGTAALDGYPRNVFLVTDGEVSSPQSVVDLIGKHAKQARVHTFGIGSGADRYLVKQAALAGKGSFQFIPNGETNMSAKVISSLSQALKPALVNIRTEWNHPDAVLVQGPNSIANTFHNEPLVLGAILSEKVAPKDLKLTIRCTETKARQELNFALCMGDAVLLPEGNELFALSAKARIYELQKNDFIHMMDTEKLSLRYKVLSKATGMIAVEKLKSKAEGKLTQVQIPVHVTKPKVQKQIQQDLFAFLGAAPAMAPPMAPAMAPPQLGFMGNPAMNINFKKSFQTSGSTVLSSNFQSQPQMGGLPSMPQGMMFGMGAPPPQPAGLPFAPPPAPPGGMAFGAAPSPPGMAAPPKPAQQSQSLFDCFTFDASGSSQTQSQPQFQAGPPPPPSFPSAAAMQFKNKAQTAASIDLLDLEEASSPKGSAAPANDLFFDFGAPQSSQSPQKQSSPLFLSFDMSSLLTLQQFDGSWNLNSSLQSLIKQCGKNVQFNPPDSFHTSLTVDMRNKVWATALAVWLLQNVFSSRKGEWKRITAKSSKLLKGMGIELKEVLELITSLAH